MWISGKQLGHAWHQTKKFVRGTYHEGRKWASTINGYAQLFRRGRLWPHLCCKIWVLVMRWVQESKRCSHMIRFESR